MQSIEPRCFLITVIAFMVTEKTTAGEPGLKATLGSFWTVPITTKEAAANGWKLDDPDKGCYNIGKYYGYRWLEPGNVAIGLLYNWERKLVGVQMMLDYDIFDENDYRFDLEPFYQVSNYKRKLYWTLTAYFVHPSIICDGVTRVSDNRFNGILYYQNGPCPSDQHLVEVPFDRPAATNEGWSAVNCIDTMGFHNLWYVNEFKEYNCTRFRPALLLFDNYGYRQGFGFWAMGRKNTSNRLEEPPGPIIKKLMGETAPQCITTQPTTTIHFFTIKDPANFKCTNEHETSAYY